MRMLIVGAGSTGGYFGGRLAAAGRDVTFLVRPKRAEQLRAGGLHIVSPHGDLTIAPKIVTAPEIASPFDVVVLTVKAFALESAMEDLAAAVGPETMILPLLNGLRHLDALVVRFGGAHVLGGTCYVSTTLDDAGRVVQLNEMQELAYGEISGEITARITALDAALAGGGFTARLSSDIVGDMWRKWMMLASLGAANCLARGNIGQLAAVESGHSIALRVLAEALAIAAEYRSGLDQPDYVARIRGMLTDGQSTVTSSMYRDMVAGLPTEHEHILGDLLTRAMSYGVDAPLLTAATVQLRVNAGTATPRSA